MDILELAALLEKITQVHRTAADEVLSVSHVSPATAGLLWELSRRKERGATMSELAAALVCDPSYVTLLARQLEASGLAERQPDAQDGRRRILRLTDSGTRTVILMTEAVRRASPLAALPGADIEKLTTRFQTLLPPQPTQPPGSYDDAPPTGRPPTRRTRSSAGSSTA
ncbi:MAG: hypothetical protein JWQ19_3712 [Subtercola sp.]|nr:hypothetical protein [Subtercola sp.]